MLRSDLVRKELCGVDPTHPLGAHGYTPARNEQVYRTIGERAATALAAGHAVIVDAVHSRADERRAAECIAAGGGVPFTGLWLEASKAVLIARVGERWADESDASVEVVKSQLGYDLGAGEWPRIDAAGALDAVLAAARRALEPG